MADEEHLKKLLEGMLAWNDWRITNRSTLPDLADADLQRAILQGADLQGADLQRAELQGAELQVANLKNADLLGANLLGADLRGANLQDADLEEADLLDANLQRAYLVDVDLVNADLGNADLRGATLLPKYPTIGDKRSWRKLLSNTKGDAATLLPDGVERPDWWDTGHKEPVAHEYFSPAEFKEVEQISGLPIALAQSDDRLAFVAPAQRQDVPANERASLFRIVRTQAEKFGKRWKQSNAVSQEDKGDADELISTIGDDPASLDGIYVSGLLETMSAVLPPDLEDADHRLSALLTALRASLLQLCQTYEDYRAYEQRVADEANAPSIPTDQADEFAGIADSESLEEALEPASLGRLQDYRRLFQRARNMSAEFYSRAKVMYLGAIRNIWAAAITRLWQVQEELAEKAGPIDDWIDREADDIAANASQEVKDAYARFKDSPLRGLWNLTKKLKPFLGPIAIYLGLSKGL